MECCDVNYCAHYTLTHYVVGYFGREILPQTCSVLYLLLKLIDNIAEIISTNLWFSHPGKDFVDSWILITYFYFIYSDCHLLIITTDKNNENLPLAKIPKIWCLRQGGQGEEYPNKFV